MPGCARSDRPVGVEGGVEGDFGEGQVGRITAPPRDLTPALHYAAARQDMAIERIQTRDDGTRLYNLVTLRNEPVVVEVRSDIWPTDDRTPTALTIEARVGRFGDEARERALVREIIARLRQLMD